MVNQLAFDMFHSLKPIREAKHANHYVFLHPCHCIYWFKVKYGFKWWW